MLERSGDDMLKEALSWAVKLLNKRINVHELKRKYSPTEDRTLMLKILGKNFESGLIVDMVTKEIVLMNPANLPKVTVSAVMSEDTFWLMIMGKVTLAECFFDRTHPIALEGDATLRDMKIFSTLELELRDVFAEVWK